MSELDRKPLDIDSCPSHRELRAYAGRKLAGERNERIYLHLKHCERCLETLAKLTSVPSPDDIIAGRPSKGLWSKLRALFPRKG